MEEKKKDEKKKEWVRAKKEGKKILLVKKKFAALSTNYRIALEMINAVVVRDDTFQMSRGVDFQLAIRKI